MNKASDLLGGLTNQIRSAIENVRPWRAQANSVSGGRVTIKPFESSALGELSAQLRNFDVVAGDEILVVDVAGRPFVLGSIQRSAPTAREMSASLFLKGGTQLRLYNVANSGYPIALDGANGNARFDGNVTVGGTLTVNGGTSGGAPWVYQETDATPTTASTTNTSTYQEQGSISVALPSGTWTVYVTSFNRLAHSAGGSISSRVDIAGNQGSAFTGSAASTTMMFVSQHSRTGQTGTIAVKSQFLNNAAGTAYSGACSFLVIAIKE